MPCKAMWWAPSLHFNPWVPIKQLHSTELTYNFSCNYRGDATLTDIMCGGVGMCMCTCTGMNTGK